MNDVQKAQTGAFLPGLAFSSTACFNGDKENERQLKCSCCGFGIQFMIFFDRYHLQPQFMFPPEQANVRIAKKTENRLQCLSHFTESPVWQVTASPSSLCLTCIFRCIWPWALQNKHLIWHGCVSSNDQVWQDFELELKRVMDDWLHIHFIFQGTSLGLRGVTGNKV